MIDIALVAALLYQVYKLLKGSVAIKIFLGFLSLYLIYLLVQAIRMELLTIILGQFMGVGVIAAIIIFAPEFRKFLLILGRSSIFSNDNGWKDMLFFWRKKENSGFNISPIIDAAKVLAGTNTGALIVISSTVELKFYAESGDILDAELSKRLLIAIFNKHSPLHDGAVIIHKG
jgi:DNA integrity scanning protein DisA with diadenylate cyclase activity